MLYSAKTGGFYKHGLHSSIPADAIEISDDEYQALLSGQMQGKFIVAAPGGRPTLAENKGNEAPIRVTMRQARLALLAAGHLDAVQAAFDAMPADVAKAAKIEWEYAGHVERQSVFTQQMAAMLNLDEAALDAIFLAASKL